MKKVSKFFIKVFILGGQNVVSDTVARDLKGHNVECIHGYNRVETAIKIAKR